MLFYYLLLNHDHNNNVRWFTYERNAEYRYKMRAFGEIKKGSELQISYGKLNNWELLCRYGFAIDDVPQDIGKGFTVFNTCSKTNKGKQTYLRIPDKPLKFHSIP